MYEATEVAKRRVYGSETKTRHIWWSALALVGAIDGCSNQVVNQAAVGGGTAQVSGVVGVDRSLPRPELLHNGGPGQPDMVYFDPGFAFSSYHSILLDPVTIVSRPTSDLSKASPRQRQTLANLYYSDLYSTLKPHCDLARRPGPGTLCLTFALTDAETSDGVEKTLATYTRYVMVEYKAGSVTFNSGAGFFSGTASTEAYATNSVTRELLWQGAGTRAGSVALAQNTTNSLNDVDNAMTGWAQQTVTRL